jgi:hypothetical protein
LPTSGERLIGCPAPDPLTTKTNDKTIIIECFSRHNFLQVLLILHIQQILSYPKTEEQKTKNRITNLIAELGSIGIQFS